MKTTKLISIVIVLSIVMSLFSGITVLAEDGVETVFQKEGDWTVNGWNNYLSVNQDAHSGRMNITEGNKYFIQFDLIAPNSKSSWFLFDWADYKADTKSQCAGFKSSADSRMYSLSEIFDDGSGNDCVGAGVYTGSFDAFVSRGESSVTYTYSIIWDTVSKTFDIYVEYITASSIRGEIEKRYAYTNSIADSDVFKFCCTHPCKVRDFTVYDITNAQPEPTETPTPTETPVPTATPTEVPEGITYTPENGWDIGGATEVENGKLKLGKGIANAAKFTPNLEKNKKYEITYDVSGLTVVGGSWRKPFTLTLTAGGQTEQDVLTYRMAGQWRNSKTDAFVADGSNGQNKIIIDTKTGEWEAYALGELGSFSGATINANGAEKKYYGFSDMSDFTLNFYSFDTSTDFDSPYISNVNVTELVPEKPKDYFSIDSYTTSSAGAIYAVTLDDKFETGKKYILSWNIKPKNIEGFSVRCDILYGNTASTAYNGNDFGFFLLYDDGGNALGMSNYGYIGKVGDETAEVTEKGIDMSMIWDTAKGEADISVTFPTGKTYKYTYKAGVIGEGQKYGSLALQGPHTPVTVSNLSIKRYDLINDEPAVLKASDVKIYAGDVEQTSDKVSTFTDKIIVDFGRYMNVDDMTDENIYVIDKSTGEKVADGEYSYHQGKYTLDFENGFEAGKTYTVYVGRVYNAAGAYSDEFSKDFTVNKGRFAKIVNITKNDEIVKNLSDLNGDVTVNVNYSGCDEKPEINIVAAFYNNARLVNADYIKKNTSSQSNGIRYSADYTVPVIVGGYDEVMFMMWDDFASLKPLSAPMNSFETPEMPQSNDGNNGKLEVIVSKDLQNGTVNVKTTSQSDDIVTIQVLEKGTTPEQINNSPETGKEKTSYVGNQIADKNGKTNFSFPLNEGDYTVYAASKKTEGDYYSQNINFSDFDTYAELIRTLKAQNKTDFVQTAEENKKLLGFDIPIYSTAALNRLYNEYKDELSENDYELNLSYFKKCALTDSLKSNSDEDGLKYIKEIYADDEDLNSDLEKYIKTESQREFYNQRLMSIVKKSVQKSENITDAAKEALILTVVKYPDEEKNIKNVMTKYKAVLGLNELTGYASVYRLLSVNIYDTKDELLKAYNDALKPFKDTSTGVSSGGGFGGGSGGGKIIPSLDKSAIISLPSDAGNIKDIKIFNDIDDVPWAKTAIEELYKAGVVNGKELYKFYPNDNVLREEFVKMLVAAFDVKFVGSELPFADINPDEWYYEYVKTAYIGKAANGISDTEFGIGRQITREDLCVMTYRMLRECDVVISQNSEEKAFADGDEISDYAKDAVDVLTKAGIINGDENGCFNPQMSATRAETAKIMYGILKMIGR